MIVPPGHLPEAVLAQVVAAAESAPATAIQWAAIVLGGGGAVAAIVTPIVTARVRKVRQHSDTREDTVVDNAALTAALEAWKSFATDAVATAKDSAATALAAARESLADKDRQIEDQKQIIRQYQQLVEDVQKARSTDAKSLADAIRAKHDAETKAHELAQARDNLAQRVADAEAKLVELTMPKNVVQSHRDRHDLHAVE